jgi:hypothetical protein
MPSPKNIIEQDAGTLNSILFKAKNAVFTNLLSTELLETEFFSLFDEKTVAQSHIGSIIMHNERLNETFPLITVQQFDLQDNSFKFSIDEFARIVAQKPTFEPVDVTYYDTYDWYFTNRLIKWYNNQFNSFSGLLKPWYRGMSIILRQGQHIRNYNKCAISKPKEFSYTNDLGVLQFKLLFVYHEYTEDYLDLNSIPQSTSKLD